MKYLKKIFEKEIKTDEILQDLEDDFILLDDELDPSIKLDFKWDEDKDGFHLRLLFPKDPVGGPNKQMVVDKLIKLGGHPDNKDEDSVLRRINKKILKKYGYKYDGSQILYRKDDQLYGDVAKLIYKKQ